MEFDGCGWYRICPSVRGFKYRERKATPQLHHGQVGIQQCMYHNLLDEYYLYPETAV